MAKKSDIGGKRLIGLSPTAWGHWVTGNETVQVQEILNNELQWIERETDVLIKAHSPEYGDFILLNELQLRHDVTMARRMRAYAGLVEEKYGLPVYPKVWVTGLSCGSQYSASWNWGENCQPLRIGNYGLQSLPGLSSD